MKRVKCMLFAASITLVMFLSGCGDKLYELTDEQEDIIVRYSAHVLGKYNIYQKDGMTGVRPEEPEASEEPVGNVDDTQGNGLSSGEAGGNNITPVTGTTTFAEAIGHSDDLAVVYEKIYAVSSYQEGGYYDLPAEEGYVYLVAELSVSNPGAADIGVDNMSRAMAFSIALADGNVYTSDKTVLLNDFSSYQGTVAAGDSRKLVLLFHVPEAESEQIGEIQFFVTENSEKKSIIL